MDAELRNLERAVSEGDASAVEPYLGGMAASKGGRLDLSSEIRSIAPWAENSWIAMRTRYFLEGPEPVMFSRRKLNGFTEGVLLLLKDDPWVTYGLSRGTEPFDPGKAWPSELPQDVWDSPWPRIGSEDPALLAWGLKEAGDRARHLSSSMRWTIEDAYGEAVQATVARWLEKTNATSTARGVTLDQVADLVDLVLSRPGPVAAWDVSNSPRIRGDDGPLSRYSFVVMAATDREKRKVVIRSRVAPLPCTPKEAWGVDAGSDPRTVFAFEDWAWFTAYPTQNLGSPRQGDPGVEGVERNPLELKPDDATAFLLHTGRPNAFARKLRSQIEKAV